MFLPKLEPGATLRTWFGCNVTHVQGSSTLSKSLQLPWFLQQSAEDKQSQPNVPKFYSAIFRARIHPPSRRHEAHRNDIRLVSIELAYLRMWVTKEPNGLQVVCCLMSIQTGVFEGCQLRQGTAYLARLPSYLLAVMSGVEVECWYRVLKLKSPVTESIRNFPQSYCVVIAASGKNRRHFSHSWAFLSRG